MMFLYDFSNMPTEVTQDIGDLKPDTAYTVEIYPEGFFKNRGNVPLKAAFRTE